MNMKELPIGTVVLLKGGLKKVMITGYSSVSREESDKVYDYNGCIFPEGLMENVFCLFDASQIEEVFFKGLENDEFKNNLEDRKTVLNSKNSRALSDYDSAGQNRSSSTKHKKYKPTHPLSKGEMLSRYGVKKKSSIDSDDIVRDRGL